MFIRLLNLVVIAGLICAAAYVYDIKYETTRRAQKVVQLRIELRHERNASATLRAEWAKLENPARIEEMAKRHLTLRSVQPYQFGNIERVAERAPQTGQPDDDPIGAMLDKTVDAMATGSVGASRSVKANHKGTPRAAPKVASKIESQVASKAMPPLSLAAVSRGGAPRMTAPATTAVAGDQR